MTDQRPSPAGFALGLIGLIVLVTVSAGCRSAVREPAASRSTLAIPSSGIPADWGPIEQLREDIERLRTILEDRTPTGAYRRREVLRKIANEMFEVPDMAARTLGLHWLALTAAQRAEFVGLFRDLLAFTLITRIHRHANAQILYEAESVAGDDGTARARIVREQGPRSLSRSGWFVETRGGRLPTSLRAASA